MTSVPQKNSSNQAKPASSTDTIIRVVLFLVLGYMVFALAYDFLYVFKTHEAKFQELSALVEKETARSADERKKGAIGPKDVQETMGFAPSVPLEDKGHYHHERYTFHRALPFMTRDIDVFYKKYQGDIEPGIYSVAHSEEEAKQAEPTKAVEPREITEEDAPPADTKGGKKKKSDDTETGTTPDDTKTDPPTDTPPTDPAPDDTKSDPVPDETKTDPAPEETKSDAADEETKE